MRYLEQNKITLLNTNAPVEDYPEWDSSSTYNKNDKVIYNNHIWTSLIDNNSSEPGADLNWFDEGATNPYRVLDEYINTYTHAPNDKDLTFTFETTNLNAIAFFGIYGQAIKIVIKDKNDTIISNETIDLVSNISSWEDYFFGEIYYREKLYYPTPNLFYAKVEITIVKKDQARLGLIRAGRSTYLGITATNVNASITDYSKKKVNSNGIIYLEKGNFADRISCETQIIGAAQYNAVKNRLEKLRATPTVYIIDETDTYFELLIYGYYENFSGKLENCKTSRFTIDIQGLI